MWNVCIAFTNIFCRFQSSYQIATTAPVAHGHDRHGSTIFILVYSLQHCFCNWECLELFGDLALKVGILSIERNMFVAHLCGMSLPDCFGIPGFSKQLCFGIPCGNKISSTHNDNSSNQAGLNAWCMHPAPQQRGPR